MAYAAVPPTGSHSSRGAASSTPLSARLFRAHPRQAARLKALLTHVTAGWQRYVAVENIGLGGARLLVDEPLARFDSVTLSLTAPTLWDPLCLRGRVAWTWGEELRLRAGLAFEHQSADDVLSLYELIVTIGRE